MKAMKRAALESRKQGRAIGYVSSTLKGAGRHLTDAQRANGLAAYDHYVAQCEEVRTTAKNDPHSLAFSIQAKVDELMTEMVGRSEHAPHVACRKGCAACCGVSVDVFPQEAMLLRRVAREQGIAVDEAKLARQAAKTMETWRELSPEDRTCVFLGPENECKVYEYRPAACRKYLVRDTAEFCDPVKHPGHPVPIVFSLQAEVLWSAALTTYGAGPMARQLLKHSGTKGRP